MVLMVAAKHGGFTMIFWIWRWSGAGKRNRMGTACMIIHEGRLMLALTYFSATLILDIVLLSLEYIDGIVITNSKAWQSSNTLPPCIGQ